jgi:hypothetical protein
MAHMDSVLVKSATGLMLLTGIVMMFPDPDYP